MRKQVFIFIAVSLVILCVGYALFELFVRVESNEGLGNNLDSSADLLADEKSPPSQDDHTPETETKLRILSTVGTVEKRSGQSNSWVPVFTGDELRAKDSIKTDRNAIARLAAQDNSELELREESEIGLGELTSKVHAIDLKEGQLEVRYRKDKSRTIRVSSLDNGSVAESDSGNFVIQNHQGTVSLATSEGEIKLTSNNETVVVSSGQYSTATKGRSPGPAAPIPLEVMLRVAKTNLRAKNAKQTVIEGQTNPGARVFASGIQAQTDPNGTFEVRVPRHPKQKQIRLVASTPWGSRSENLQITPSGPGNGPTRIEKANVRWGRKSDSTPNR